MDISYENLKDYKVKLLKNFVDSIGNLYSPRVYSPGELSKHAYRPGYVIPVEEVERKNVEPEEILLDPYGEIQKQKDAHIAPQKPSVDYKEITLEEERQSSKPEEFPIYSETKNTNRILNINTASKLDIQALKGVGRATAEKVLNLREKGAFIDFQDLNERVELGFGRNWEDYPIEF